ncbi:MAG: hypothetical protein PHX83_04165 [Acidobacteriia bacterium]|nr:hypothetical protein [Terriglobia bacterium]
MKKLAMLFVIILIGVVSVFSAEKRTLRPYNVVEAKYLPYSLDVDSTVKLLPRNSRPSSKTPQRCLVLELEMRLGSAPMTFTTLYFDQFALAFNQDGLATTVPAVGVGVGPLPTKAGDPEEQWKDQWEIGQAKGTFSIGGNPEKTSKMKLLFIVPQDVVEATLMQKSAAGEMTVVKAGIRITN